jgi:hypothetical protein
VDLGVAIGRGRGRLLLQLRAGDGGRGDGAAVGGGLDQSKRTGWHAGRQRDGVGAVVAGSVQVVRQQPRRLVGSHLRLGTVL